MSSATNENGNKVTDNEAPKEETNMVVFGLNEIKRLAANNREIHKKLIEDGSVSFAVLQLDSDCPKVLGLSLDILQYFAQYPENRPALSNIVHIFDALQSVVDKPKQVSAVCKRALWISTILKQKGLEIKQDKKRRPLGDKNPNEQIKTERGRGKKNSKYVYLRIPDVCLEANRNAITDTLKKLEGVISITFLLQKSVCLILCQKRIQSEVYGKAVANMGFECDLVAWDSNGEEVWLRQHPDKYESSTIAGQENTPDYFPDSFNEKEENPQAVIPVPVGEQPDKAGGGGWLTSAANFLQKSFYW